MICDKKKEKINLNSTLGIDSLDLMGMKNIEKTKSSA